MVTRLIVIPCPAFSNTSHVSLDLSCAVATQNSQNPICPQSLRHDFATVAVQRLVVCIPGITLVHIAVASAGPLRAVCRHEADFTASSWNSLNERKGHARAYILSNTPSCQTVACAPSVKNSHLEHHISSIRMMAGCTQAAARLVEYSNRLQLPPARG